MFIAIALLVVISTGCNNLGGQVDYEVTITASPAVPEGSAAEFTLSADPAPAALADPLPQTVTIMAGATQATLSVETVDDATDEFPSTVTTTLTEGSGYTLGARVSAEVTVSDDDRAPEPEEPGGGGPAEPNEPEDSGECAYDSDNTPETFEIGDPCGCYQCVDGSVGTMYKTATSCSAPNPACPAS